MRILDFATLTGIADSLESIVRQSGRAIMDIYATDFDVQTKTDDSPVTEADKVSEAIILNTLTRITPEIPFVAEEHTAEHGFPKFDGNTFWLIDALDGTKEFINKRGAFTVNIGLIVDGVPCLGIVFAPARNEYFRGVVCAHTGKRAAYCERNGQQQELSVRPIPENGVTVVGSLSHQVKDAMDKFLARHYVREMIAIGSSLKFCMVAEGRADLYPRFGPTCEWDIAAGHAILLAAGGNVKTFDGENMQYKKEKAKYRNGAFLAAGSA